MRTAVQVYQTLDVVFLLLFLLDGKLCETSLYSFFSEIVQSQVWPFSNTATSNKNEKLCVRVFFTYVQY